MGHVPRKSFVKLKKKVSYYIYAAAKYRERVLLRSEGLYRVEVGVHKQ